MAAEIGLRHKLPEEVPYFIPDTPKRHPGDRVDRGENSNGGDDDATARTHGRSGSGSSLGTAGGRGSPSADTAVGAGGGYGGEGGEGGTASIDSDSDDDAVVPSKPGSLDVSVVGADGAPTLGVEPAALLVAYPAKGSETPLLAPPAAAPPVAMAVNARRQVGARKLTPPNNGAQSRRLSRHNSADSTRGGNTLSDSPRSSFARKPSLDTGAASSAASGAVVSKLLLPKAKGDKSSPPSPRSARTPASATSSTAAPSGLSGDLRGAGSFY
jgi:hypothetical protein